MRPEWALHESRSAELQRKGRKVLLLGFAVATAIHVALLLFSPTFEIELGGDPFVQRAETPPSEGTARFLDAYFGPPAIRLEGGAVWQEPPNRFLDEKEIDVRSIGLSNACGNVQVNWGQERTGAVNLVVSASGRVSSAEVAESTGEPCPDEMFVAIAASVRYAWLPNDQFEAPVSLTQPMRVVGSRF